MSSYTNFYLINQHKSNLLEAQNYRCFLTTDCKFLWKVCKDFINTIEIDCYVYRNNQFLYDFRDLKSDKLLRLNSLQIDNPNFATKDYQFEVMGYVSELQAITKAKIGFITAKSIGVSVKTYFLFNELPNHDGIIATKKQFDKFKQCLSKEGIEFMNYWYPDFEFIDGKHLICFEY